MKFKLDGLRSRAFSRKEKMWSRTLAAAALLGALPIISPRPGAIRVYSTIYSVGIEWDISGDPDHDATVQVEYRVQGSRMWKRGLPLLRIDNDRYNMLAGSVLFLNPGTAYEVQLFLSDPDGGADTRTVTVATRVIPTVPTGGRTFHVVPGSGGGDGSSSDPFKGIATAQAVARPKDIFLVHAGSYGAAVFNKAGTSGGNYIVWKAAGDGDASFAHIDFAASHIWVEGMTVRDQTYATFSIGAPTNVVVSRNKFVNCNYCIYLQQGGSNWYIADNDITGDVDPLGGYVDVGEGIELNHTSGHDVAYNRITRTADGISYPISNVDIYGNDIYHTADDGIELDGGVANVRVWGNRVHNVVHSAISFQPQKSGPWYIIRNQLASFKESPFKFRTTDRSVIAHNTIVMWDKIILCCNEAHLLRSIVKNNLWVSVTGGQIWDFGPSVKDWRTDFDNDGFDWGGSTAPFRYGGVIYSSLQSFSAASGLETNGRRINRSTCFETFNVPGPPPMSVPLQYMTLKAECDAIDAGTILPNIDDDFLGAAPDLGAYEHGLPLPQYGPQPVKTAPAPPIGLRVVR